MNSITMLSSPDCILSLPFTKMCSYHWESAPFYRPSTYFRLASLSGGGFVCELKCYEDNPRAVFTQMNNPVYKDSCLELFIAPVEGRAEYINIECNSLGVFLCEFGDSREGRRFVSDICTELPRVKPFSGSDSYGNFWGVHITVTADLITALYNTDAKALHPQTVRANFYKCGDDTAAPHYIAYSPVTLLPPGFHNPDCFATFNIV